MRAALKWSAFALTVLALAVPEKALAQAFAGDFSVSSGAVYQTAGTDEARAVAVDTISAGGPFIYVTGDSNNAGATVKLSSAGVALASAAFISGGTGVGRGVAVDPAGNVWVAGYSVTGGPVTNWVVQKYSPGLVVLSSAVINGVSLGDAVATSIVFDGSGDAFVAGYSSAAGTGTDFRVMKYSPSLAVLATGTFAGAGIEQAMALTLDASGNVIVTGYGSPYDYLTVKYNSSLVKLASVTYDAAGATDRGYGVTTDPSGSVYVTGESDSGGANYGFTTVKYSSGLAQLAVASYNTPSYDAGFAATFVGTATLLVAGGSYPGADEDMLILEYDPSLTLISSRTYDSGTSDRVYAVAKGTGNYVYAAGYSYTSPFGAYRTIRLDASATVNPAFPGCAATNNVGAGQAYATIQSAVNALPASLTGPACVVIKDGATYAEQVTVRGIVNNGWTVSIKPDPATGLTPSVAPPAASTAAFLIANASVTVTGIDVVPGSAIPYGVFVSSPYVTISGVIVQDAGGKIATAGVAASSWTTVSNSSVTTGGAAATAIWLPGSVMTTVTHSTAQANGANAFALRLTGASSNTISDTLLVNLPGAGAYLLNSNSNSVIRSSISCDNGTGSNAALYLTGSSSNSVTRTFLTNSFADAISVKSGSNYNAIAQSTAVLTGAGGQAAIGFTGSHYNSVSDCLLTASGGLGINLGTSNFNTVTRTTMAVTNGMGRQGLLFNVASSNTVTQSYIADPQETGISYFNGSNYNAVSLSVIVGGPSTNLYPSGVYILNGAYNTIAQSVITNAGGFGATFGGSAQRNTISLSTITSGAAGYPGAYFMPGSGTNTVTGSYVQGSTAVYVANVQGAVIDSSVLAGGALGPGVFLDYGSSGTIVLAGDTVTGALHGIRISTQSAALTITSITFSGLASSGTAVRFLGGTFVATITAASFDSSVAVNVDASRLAAASRLTMASHVGARTGAAHENDPAGLVDWQDAGPYPGCADTRNVGASQPYATISAAVAALPASLAGPSCVVIRDGATYAEQVTVRGFTTNGSSIAIFADPGTGLKPVVSPPASSTAAFVLKNDGISLSRIGILGTNAMPYGVLASSAGAAVSSVTVDSAGRIYTAGIALTTGAALSNSSVTVQNAVALFVEGFGSVMTGNSLASAASGYANAAALLLSASSSNTITGSFIANSAGGALLTTTGSHYNFVGQSTMTANGAAGGASGVGIYSSSFNVVTGCYIENAAGRGASIQYGAYDTISQSTIASNVAGDYGFNLQVDSSTLDRCRISNAAGGGVFLFGSGNLISQSAITGNSAAVSGLYFQTADSNTVTGCQISNPLGNGVQLYFGANGNTIAQSTITGGGSTLGALYIGNSSTNTVSNSYIQGSTAAIVDGSSTAWNSSTLGNVLSGNSFVATSAFGSALFVRNGGEGLTLTGGTLRGGLSGRGLLLDGGFAGPVVIGSVAVTGSAKGIEISTQAAGFVLSASSISLQGLSAGATGIDFLGGTFVATIAAASFDASVAVNVAAAALSPASRVTMSAAYGARAGAAFESDPGSLVDWPLVSAPTAFSGAAVSATAILWTWTDTAIDEAGFRIMSGTISVSGDLAANSTSWLQAGIATNTAYGPYAAQAFNAGGSASSGAASRATLAAAPPAPAASGVALTSATIAWGYGGNPAGTTFELERSTGTGYGLLSAGPATSYFDALLTPSTTFYYRVRARNVESVATVYSSTLAVVALPAPAVPGAAGTPAGTALGISSVSWTWALAGGATSYNLFRSSDAGFHFSASSGAVTFTALAPNTAYGLRAAGVNIGGIGPLSPAATVYTFAAVPSSAAATGISSTTLTAAWGLNGNSASTLSVLQRSTDALAYATLSSAAVTAYADADLLGCTTYYYRVRNFNGDGRPTSYASFSAVTGNTIPDPPAGLTAAANPGGTVGLSWALSPTEGVTGYRLYWDAGTGAVSYAAPIAVLGSTATAYTTGVLTSSASYTFALRAAHRCGSVDATGALAMSGAAAAPPPVRAAIKEPDAGRRVDGDRVTILGELVSGTPSDVQRIVFQYKLATSTAWLDVEAANVNHPNPDYDFPYFTHADATTLAPGSYDLRAVAYDRSGVADPAPPAVRVVVDPIHPDVSETLMIDGKIKKDQTVANTVTSVVDAAGAGAADPAVRVTIPAGAVNAATATVSVISNPAITTAAPSGQTMVGSAIKIDLSNGQSALNGTAAISLTYPDTVRFPSLLQIFYLNEATGQWSRDFATIVNTSSRTVTGNTPHFSTFALMLGTAFAPNLDSVQVYPVPFKPNGANANEGRPFSQGDPNSGIIFANLAEGSEIRIYTLTGRLVSKLDNAPITGTLRWDARNQDGREVVSGAYFAVIKAGGGKPVIKKLVIIR